MNANIKKVIQDAGYPPYVLTNVNLIEYIKSILIESELEVDIKSIDKLSADYENDVEIHIEHSAEDSEVMPLLCKAAGIIVDINEGGIISLIATKEKNEYGRRSPLAVVIR